MQNLRSFFICIRNHTVFPPKKSKMKKPKIQSTLCSTTSSKIGKNCFICSNSYVTSESIKIVICFIRINLNYENQSQAIRKLFSGKFCKNLILTPYTICNWNRSQKIKYSSNLKNFFNRLIFTLTNYSTRS